MATFLTFQKPNYRGMRRPHVLENERSNYRPKTTLSIMAATRTFQTQFTSAGIVSSS